MVEALIRKKSAIDVGSKLVELSVVVPTLNEQANIELLYMRVADSLDDICWEIIFVDDDSTDATRDIIRRLSQEYQNIRIIHRINRRGLSTAVIEGVLSSTAPYFAVIDADLQHDESVLPHMLTHLRAGNYDLVVGSRYITGGGFENWSKNRQKISLFATKLTKLVIKTQLSDPMSGYFMMRRTEFDKTVRSLSAQGYKILLDIAASYPGKLKHLDIPYVFDSRNKGESKFDMLVMLEFAQLLLDKTLGKWIPAKFLMFATVGGIGVVVHFTVLAVLLKSQYGFMVSQASATAVAMTSNFFLNNLFTYSDKRIRGLLPIAKGLLSFYVVCSLGAIANVGVANIIFNNDISWWLSGIAGILVGVVWNFAVSSVYTWK